MLTVNHHAAALAAVATGAAARYRDVIKIAAPHLVHGKALGAAAASKLFLRYGKMTVPAAKLTSFYWYQRQDFVFAGLHMPGCAMQRAFPSSFHQRI